LVVDNRPLNDSFQPWVVEAAVVEAAEAAVVVEAYS
jgi:hypothetical protein